jgi:hypothetical protein
MKIKVRSKKFLNAFVNVQNEPALNVEKHTPKQEAKQSSTASSIFKEILKMFGEISEWIHLCSTEIQVNKICFSNLLI